MRIRTHLTSALGLGVALTTLLGCGTAPASQSPEGANAPTTAILEQPTVVTTQSETASKAIETGTAAPKTTVDRESEPESQQVEVGYKVGMQVPEFGMSLIDGSTITSASLTDQGKPTFLYFHATW